MLRSIIYIAAAALIAGTATSSSPAAVPGMGEDVSVRVSQSQLVAIKVNGKTLSGPASQARRVGTRVELPIAAVAAALGDAIAVNSSLRRVTVTRQNGIKAELDLATRTVRDSDAIILSSVDVSAIVITPIGEGTYLPAQVVEALFAVVVTYDAGAGVVDVQRGAAGPAIAVQAADKRSAVELYQADYQYDLDRYAKASAHSLILAGTGRIADARFGFATRTSHRAGQPIIGTSLFTLERPNGQRFAVGDLDGRATSISGGVRGASAAFRVGSATVTAFAGRGASGIVGSDELQTTANSRFLLDRDTTVTGAVAETTAGRFTLSAGGINFNSGARNGTMAVGTAAYTSRHADLQGEFGFGSFRGSTPSGLRADGPAGMGDATGTLRVTEGLTLQARYSFVSRGFLTPRTGIREPISMKAAGINWSPGSWLTASLNASTASRPGDPNGDSSNISTAVALSPGRTAPRFQLVHTASNSRIGGRSEFTSLNVAKEILRFKFFANASRMKLGSSATLNGQVGAAFSVDDSNSLEAVQSIGSRGAANGQFEWRSSGLVTKRLSFTAGVGYSRSRSAELSAYEHLSARLSLPRETSLQVNFYNARQGPTVLISLRGSLFKKREGASLVGPVSEMAAFGRMTGMVYQDIDQNGSFDAGIDRPQAGVVVRIDSSRWVTTDATGRYDFDVVTAGQHSVQVDLGTIRADLTLLSRNAAETHLRPGHVAQYDFRVVKTGRVSGQVWLDSNENGQLDEGETPLADVRIVTTGGRDTLTAEDGTFSISDLAPGEHPISIDPATLPDRTAPSPLVLVLVFSGRSSDAVVRAIPAAVEVRTFGSARP